MDNNTWGGIVKTSNLDWTFTTGTVPKEAFNVDVSPKGATINYVKWGRLVIVYFNPIRIKAGLSSSKSYTIATNVLPRATKRERFLVQNNGRPSATIRLGINTNGDLLLDYSASTEDDGREYIGFFVYESKE